LELEHEWIYIHHWDLIPWQGDFPMEKLKKIHKLYPFLVPSVIFVLSTIFIMTIPLFRGELLVPDYYDMDVPKQRTYYRLKVDRGKTYWISLYFNELHSVDPEILLFAGRLNFMGSRRNYSSYDYESIAFEARYSGKYHMVIRGAKNVPIMIFFREIETSGSLSGATPYFNSLKITGFSLLAFIYVGSIGISYFRENKRRLIITRKRIAQKHP